MFQVGSIEEKTGPKGVNLLIGQKGNDRSVLIEAINWSESSAWATFRQNFPDDVEEYFSTF